MLSHPTAWVNDGTLTDWLTERFGTIHLVNRLDRVTSGVVLAARDPATAAELMGQFAARTVQKRYLARIAGIPTDQHIDLPIGRIDTAPHWTVVPDGKPAQTRLTVLSRATSTATVLLEPLTGRTNQLRIHCAAIRHPIVGDVAYGGPADVRVWLHAWSCAVLHRGMSLIVTADPSDGLHRAL